MLNTPGREPGELFLGNAGTAMRPLTAVLAVGSGTFVLSGVARMHERPIGDLVTPLRQLGARLTCLERERYPPLRIEAPRPLTAGAAREAKTAMMETGSSASA